MQPDPRLLAKLRDDLRAPEGARVWRGDRFYVHDGSDVWSEGDAMDFSAPVGGERVDLLSWGLDRLGWSLSPTVGRGEYTVRTIAHCYTVHATDVDLSGLSPDDAARAVVAAALGVRRG